MNLKELLRVYSQKTPWFEKLWIVLAWKKTRILALRYSDYEYANILFKRHTGRKLNIKNPKTLDEKAWFLKLCNHDPLLTKCSDKHLVREYIEEKGYKHILKKEYNCFYSANEIDFEALPDTCYLKCNHASGVNCIFRRSNHDNLDFIRWKFNYILKQQPYYLSREWNYKNIPPRIVCEELLHMPDGVSDIPELQFFCFSGKPKFLIYNLGLADEKGNHKDPVRWAIWPDWTIVKEAVKLNYSDVLPSIPKNYPEMMKCASDLAEPFPYVRVDLFNINGKIYFNELTFYSGGGFTLSRTDTIQQLGKLINIEPFSIPASIYKRRSMKEVKHGM